MRYLGIDYGEKRIGLALSDRDGGIAFPHSTIENNKKTLATLLSLVEAEGVGCVVMGDTRGSSGGENTITESAELFLAELEEESGLTVRRVPELYSSVEVSRYAPESSGHNDAAAAALILQRFIDMHEGDVE
jgi:putative Holliday junction resolvase